jgi:hypothetical protein
MTSRFCGGTTGHRASLTALVILAPGNSQRASHEHSIAHNRSPILTNLFSLVSGVATWTTAPTTVGILHFLTGMRERNDRAKPPGSNGLAVCAHCPNINHGLDPLRLDPGSGLESALLRLSVVSVLARSCCRTQFVLNRINSLARLCNRF